MDKILYIIRGLPGSGKSTLAKQLAPESSCEADDYFTRSDGEYIFDATKLPNAHEICRLQVENHMMVDKSVIAVANTFSEMWEITPYFDLADLYGYKKSVIECKNNFGSVHNIPDQARISMMKRWETHDYIF